MKIDIDINMQGKNKIDSYQVGNVIVSGTTYQSSLIITPDTVIQDWPPQNFTDLATQHFHRLLDLSPEIILLGTGSQLRFPAADITAPVRSNNIGLEIMDTGAACRAYNILMSEDRLVVAALLMIESG